MNAERRPDRNLYARIFRACRTVITPTTWRRRYLNDPYWRLYRNEQEGAVVTTKQGAMALRPGRLYVIPAHMDIELSCDRPIGHFYAHFDVLGLPDVALRELFDSPFQTPCEAHHERTLQEIVPDLIPESEGGQPVSIPVQCWIKTLLYEALARHLRSVSPEKIDHCWHLAERMKPVLPAVTYIEAHLAADLSNPVLARACSMSEGHFIRTFRDCMGQTPTQYVMEQRVKHAIQCLLQTTAGIDQIAEASGFGSREYLSRIFTRRTGRPPAAFRRSEYGDRA